MSLSRTNADLARFEAESRPAASSGSEGPRSSERAGHEALEALLAFCSLHQIADQKRAQQPRQASADSERIEFEQFVFDEVLQMVAERAVTIAGADGVAIALVDGNAILCRASAGTVVPDRGMRVDLNSGFSGACLVARKVVRCDDSDADFRVSAIACRRLGARSMVAVPLIAEGSVIGLIEAFSTVPYGFNDSDISNLSLLAELILAALRPEEERALVEASRRLVGPEESATAAPPLVTHEEDTHVEKSVAEAPRELSEDQPSEPEPAPAEVEESPRKSNPVGIVIALLALGLAALVVWGLAFGGFQEWKIGRVFAPNAPDQNPPATSEPAPAVNTSSAPPTSTAPSSAAPSTTPSAAPGSTAPPAAPASAAPSTDADAAQSPPGSETGHGFPEVTGIRHWSAANSSTVVIDLEDQVQYEAHRLANPERIYFDLHDTRLSPDLGVGKSIEVDDPLIQRIRVAQPEPGLTRVVIEIKGAWNFSVSLAPNPYRLVVEVHKAESNTRTRSKLDLFTPQTLGAAALVPAPGSVAPKLRIVLDAGHGGSDLGTVGRQGLLEKDVVLDIVARLGLLVRRQGAEVIYTRQDDSYVSLEKRAEIANLADADLFLSIHANSSDSPSARGVETYYTNTYSSANARPRESDEIDASPQNINWTDVDIRAKVRDSHHFASSIQRALYSMLAPKNPGLRNRGVKEAQYVVLTGTMMPAVLAEISFVSSPADENHLQNASYRQQIALALYQGIERFVEQSRRVKQASAVDQHKADLNR
jgi:N-acetylmuramoyl-L-alanine amidase/putative methionine-R-sulfoxide reductase with GAF domain